MIVGVVCDGIVVLLVLVAMVEICLVICIDGFVGGNLEGEVWIYNVVRVVIVVVLMVVLIVDVAVILER